MPATPLQSCAKKQIALKIPPTPMVSERMVKTRVLGAGLLFSEAL
jgi:hypothetical protein